MNIFEILQRRVNQIRIYNKPKVFGIGDNKTGTTSLTSAMNDLGYLIGSQKPAEFLLEDWAKRDFKKLIQHCRTAEFFQDFPFSKPYTYVILDQNFPNSKFILTIRDSSDQWYESLTKFHSKKWADGNRIPTKDDLQNAFSRWKGRPWELNRYCYTTPKDSPYEKHNLIQNYEMHNAQVVEYFRHRPNDLLVLNVAEKGAYKKLIDFLGVNGNQEDFPWRNKTSNIKIK